MKKLGLTTLVVAAFALMSSAAHATTMSYKVTEAFMDAYAIHGGGHALWMPPGGAAIPATSAKYVFTNPVGYGMFTEYFTAGEHTHAIFTGTVENENDSGNVWEISFYFEATPDGQVITPKRELKDAAYSENGGPVDVDTWRFYNFAKTSLTGKGDNAGKTLIVSQKPTDLRMPLQVGFGASGKNVNFGMSAWYNYTGDYAGHGDINVDLNPVVPEPASMALFGTGLAGAFIRRKFFG